MKKYREDKHLFASVIRNDKSTENRKSIRYQKQDTESDYSKHLKKRLRKYVQIKLNQTTSINSQTETVKELHQIVIHTINCIRNDRSSSSYNIKFLYIRMTKLNLISDEEQLNEFIEEYLPDLVKYAVKSFDLS